MTTLISNVSELTAWLNSPSGTGQLTADITINVRIWTIEATPILTSGMILDGNYYTIFLENTITADFNFSGILKLNGGTVQNLKISGSPANNFDIRINSGNSYLTRTYDTSQKTGTLNNVWFDGCDANRLSQRNAASPQNISVFGRLYNYTITNCQIGRDINNPYFFKSGPFSGIMCGGNCNLNVSNSVIFASINGGPDIGAFCSIFSTGSISRCIVMLTLNTVGGYCSAFIGGRNQGNWTVTDCYTYIKWGINAGGDTPAIYLNEYTSGNTLTVQNNYILIDLIGSGSFATQPVLVKNVIETNGTVNLTNVAYTGSFPYTSGSLFLNVTNCIQNYTSITPNTNQPIASFSGVTWNKTYTPPLLAFNSITPWQSINTSYDNPNSLNFTSIDPVITWNPSPSTLLYPSPLTTKQLNATANVAGTFTYNPTLGTILNIGASQTLNATFVPSVPLYNTVFPTATVSVVQAPYKYIFTQGDLYDFLQNYSTNSWTKGLIINNISLNIAIWTKPTTTFGSGVILDGRGKTITMTGTNSNWTGLFNLTGGTVKNFTYDKGSAIITFPGGSGSSPNGLLFGQNGSIPVNRSTVDGISLLNFRVPIVKSTTGGFAGRYNNIDFMNCQLGTSSAPYLIESNTCGGFAPDFFTGSFTNCIAYLSYSGAQNSNGGFVYNPAGSLTFTKCRASGILQGTGQNGGFVGNTAYDLYFNNCYTYGSINNDSGASTTGGFVGNVQNSVNISMNNSYYLSTSSVAATAGTFVSSTLSSGNTFYLNLYNTASSSTNITSSSVTTNSTSFINNLVPQYFNNSPSFSGFNNSIYDIAVIGSDIYVGGSFTSVNGDSGIQYLAKWTASTSSWGSVGGGVVNGIVYTMTVSGSNLYIGGSFTLPGNSIVIWNGSSFSQISGDTFNGAVRTIYVQSVSNIYIGGEYTLMNGVTTMRHISIWNGSAWIEPNNGLNNNVLVIVGDVTGVRPFIGGKFTALGDGTGTFNRLCYYTGSIFSNVGSSTAANAGVNSDVNTLLRDGNNLYIGGKFTTNNLGSPTTLNRLGVINVSNTDNPINAVGSGTIGFNNDVNKIAINSDILYIVGAFTTAGGFTANNIAVYNSTATGTKPWSSSSLRLNNTARTILLNGTTFYVGGDFTNLNNVAGTAVVSNVNRFVQIPIGYNKTDYSATGQPSLTTPPIMSYDTYFTS